MDVPEPAHAGFLAAVPGALAAHADPARAIAQQRYMRSAMPFLGLSSPVLYEALAPVLADPALAMSSAAQWRATILALWDGATHREQWYAAIALARHRTYRDWVDDDAMALWENLIRRGAWWDVVDAIATHLVRETVLSAHEVEAPRLRLWALDADLWIRRAAILSQVGAAQHTDPALLADVIGPNLAEREFFIRKAIGWALRDYARTDPIWVRRFVAREPTLSGLSRREALKHLGPDA